MIIYFFYFKKHPIGFNFFHFLFFFIGGKGNLPQKEKEKKTKEY